MKMMTDCNWRFINGICIGIILQIVCVTLASKFSIRLLTDGYMYTLRYLIAIVLAFVLLRYFRRTCSPIDDHRQLTAIERAKAQKIFTRKKQSSTTSGSGLLGIPCGWYHVADSEEVKAGSSLRIAIGATEMVLFRPQITLTTPQPTCAILDAYCPHLGAHLGYGGKVVNDCIECPFHGWQFNSSGQCTNIPYAKSVPSVAKTKAYQTIEDDGRVYLFWNPESNEAVNDHFARKPHNSLAYKRCGSISIEVRGTIEDIVESFFIASDNIVFNSYGVSLTMANTQSQIGSSEFPSRSMCFRMHIFKRLIVEFPSTLTLMGPTLLKWSIEVPFLRNPLIITISLLPKEVWLHNMKLTMWSTTAVSAFYFRYLLRRLCEFSETLLANRFLGAQHKSNPLKEIHAYYSKIPTTILANTTGNSQMLLDF